MISDHANEKNFINFDQYTLTETRERQAIKYEASPLC